MAAMVMANRARGESQQVRVSLTALLAQLQAVIISPGALLTVGSGILWSMAIVGAGSVESRVAPIGLWIMTGAGLVGGFLIAVVAMPTAIKLKAIAVVGSDGQVLPLFERHKKRLDLVSAVAGICALVSLFASVLAP